jgi:hypothetical protein
LLISATSPFTSDIGFVVPTSRLGGTFPRAPLLISIHDNATLLRFLDHVSVVLAQGRQNRLRIPRHLAFAASMISAKSLMAPTDIRPKLGFGFAFLHSTIALSDWFQAGSIAL